MRADSNDSDPNLFSVNYHGPLKGLLDQVATRAEVRWAFQGGAIRFFRVISRSIPVRSLPGNVTQSGGVQLSSGMSITSDVEMNIWSGIEKTLQQMVSRQGRLHVDPALGVVNVRDAAVHVEAIEKFLDGVNRQLARQVSLSVEVLQVALSNRFESGIDWNYVRQVTGMGTFTAGGLPTVTGATANVGFIRASGGGATSTLMIKALETFGRVSTSYSSVINTMNRQAVPVGSVNTQSYLKQITPSATSSATGAISYGPPGLTPGEIITGFNMTLLPIVLDSNMVLMQCGLSISSLKEIVPFSSGTGLAQQTIQQPNVSSFLTLQRMAVRTGDTIVLSGFESETTESKQNDIRRHEIPGTRASNRDKTIMVILITPRLLEF
jgi:type IVB pilus formation R64 PilN family outer membrane protein